MLTGILDYATNSWKILYAAFGLCVMLKHVPYPLFSSVYFDFISSSKQTERHLFFLPRVFLTIFAEELILYSRVPFIGSILGDEDLQILPISGKFLVGLG